MLCGGRSAEHEVSLRSARQILRHLDPSRYKAEIVFIDRSGRWLAPKRSRDQPVLGAFPGLAAPRVAGTLSRETLDSRALIRGSRAYGSNPSASGGRGFLRGSRNRAPDVVLPVLHGPMGEDGTVQGLLELAGVPYVGCGVLGSAVGMDKEVSKRLAAQAGVAVLPYLVIRRGASPDRRELKRLGWPLFVKPARLGSSVGVSKVKGPRELPRALISAFRYDDKLLLEKAISARELECAVLGDPWSEDPGDRLRLEASVCGEVVPRGEFYTYHSKYLDPQGARLVIPAKVPARTAKLLREWSKLAFRALDGYGMGRVDFLVEARTGRPYFSEVNTIPGFTSGSMYPLLWEASGVPFPELLSRLIELALRRYRVRSKLKTRP